MRIAALLLALAAWPALAAGPNDYRARATIMLTGSDPLQRVVLPSPPLEIGRRPARYWMARLDSASVGGAPRPDSAWQRWVDTATPLRIILWGILLGAVGMLGFMAWRIFRHTPPPGPPGPR